MSTRQLLVRRVRIILLICLLSGIIFAGLELWAVPNDLPPAFYVKMIGISLAAGAFMILGQPRAARYAWTLSIGIVIVAYLLTALSGIISSSGEYVTTAVLFVGAALTTAILLPWGLWPQLLTVMVGMAALAVAVIEADGNLHAIGRDPAAAVLIAFVLSLVTAREVDRYRVAHQRELQMRRRTEIAMKRLNTQLERRVQERTAELERANRILAAEIAERRRAADALRESQAQLTDTMDNSTAMVSLKDLEGRYLVVNREFERCFGRTRDQVMGRRDDELFPATVAMRLGVHDAIVFASEAPVSFEQSFTVGHEERAYVCVKFPLRSAGGAPYGVGTIATDISPVKQLQEEVQRHQAELAHVLRLQTMGEMAAALAHEVNQPLCAITNYAQGGAQRLRQGAIDTNELLQAFEHIGREGLRAARILRGIRNLVKREGEPRAEIDVNALTTEAVRVLEPQARMHEVAVSFNGSGRLPTIRGDATQIEQVILNLMLNGVEAVASSEGERREVRVTTAVNGESVEVSVTDTGTGISPNVTAKLFTPFFTTKARGLGLGLAISRWIVESHGGQLWALPNDGAGTTFRFSLPVGDSHPANVSDLAARLTPRA